MRGFPEIGGHGKQVADLVALHRDGIRHGALSDQGKAGVFCLLFCVFIRLIVQNFFQPVQMPCRWHCVQQHTAAAQHPAELLPGKGRKDVQQNIRPAIPHRGAEAAAHRKSGFRQ